MSQKLESYRIQPKWFFPIFGGHSLDHFAKAKKETTWKGKAVQILAGLAESTPVLGHTISFLEKGWFGMKDWAKKNNCTLTVFGVTVHKQNFDIKRLTGSGNIVKESRSLPPFQKIVNNSMLDITLSQSPQQKVEVEGDDNMLEQISTKVENGTLYIRLLNPKGYHGIHVGKRLKVYLEAEKIDQIVHGGMGKITSSGVLQFDNLAIKHSGMGNLTMSLEGKVLTVNHSGMGNCNFKGAVGKQILHLSGMGNYNANRLVSDSAKITKRGMGTCTVNAKHRS